MNNDLYNPRDRVHRVMDRVLYTVIVIGVLGCGYLAYSNFMKWTA